MDVTSLLKDHYSGDDLAARVLAAVRTPAAQSVDASWVDLAGIDNLHAGGLPATRYLLSALDLSARSRLVDVGCGIGGTARCAAADHGCQVLGVDLSEDFVRAAAVLTERCGLDDLATFATNPGDLSPIDDETFDRATLVHVGMNVPDKAALFAEVRRVLVAGGRFGLYEQMRVGDGDVAYPLPWAADRRSSFVTTVDDYVDSLLGAGFTIDLVQSRTAETAAGPPPSGPGPEVLFGPEFATRIANNVAATRAGVLGAVVIIASRT
jgi:MPBQ/MSBQ methyltransferase